MRIYEKGNFELFAKDVLEFVLYNEYYGKLKKEVCDKPDFQTVDNSMGIEFTLVGDYDYFRATGIYQDGIYDEKDSSKIKKYEEEVKSCGWLIDEQGFSTKAWGTNDVIIWIKKSFDKKIKELQNYANFLNYRLLMWGAQNLVDYKNPEILKYLLDFFIQNNTKEKGYSLVYYFTFRYYILFDLVAKEFKVIEFDEDTIDKIKKIFLRHKHHE